MTDAVERLTQPLGFAASAPSIEHRVSGYLDQLNSLIVIRHLNLLLIAAQKHRGATLASLDGGVDFSAKVPVLQAEIDSYLAVLERLNTQAGELIPAAELAAMHREWEGLVYHLDEVSVLSNFELHSRFTGKLLKVIWGLASRAKVFTRSDTARLSEREGGYAARDHRALVQITMRLLPELIESIAKLRGLATHAAVCTRCDAEDKARFSYLFQQLNCQNEALRKLSASLQRDTLSHMPTLSQVLLHDHKLGQLQDLITHQIIVVEPITVKGRVIFDFASEIIDIYHRTINDGVSCVQSFIENRI